MPRPRLHPGLYQLRRESVLPSLQDASVESFDQAFRRLPLVD